MNELDPELRLTGDHVALLPLSLDHEEALINAASDGKLWELKFTGVPDAAATRNYIQTALQQRAAGKQQPFVVQRLSDANIVGCTRFYDIEREHRNMAIGYTWYSRSVQRTAVNTEAKLLLLSHAFEQMGCIGIAFHTDNLNERSQAAILRLGAKHEGVLRNHRIMPDGRIRHTWCFSITRDEWPSVAKNLRARLKAG